MNSNYFHGDLQCEIINGKKVLVPVSSIEPKYQMFIDTLLPGQKVSSFLETVSDTGTYPQLSMIHAMIRKMAMESGYTFDEMKKEVKNRSGLKVGDEYKSFADCSIEELSLAIQACIEIGRIMNLNLQ